MRWFWLTLLLLGIVGLGLAVRSDPDAPSAAAPDDFPPTADPVAARRAPDATTPPEAIATAPPAAVSDAVDQAVPNAATETRATSPSLDDLLGTDSEIESTDPAAPPAPDSVPALETELTTELAAQLTADGATVDLDGAGTAESPYRASWTMLEEMRRTYRPQDGVREVPPVVAALDGSVVEIAGFHLMPWTRGDVSQILLLKYIWDGCCIGVPPSPFTAIDVEFSEPTPRTALPSHALTTIRGTLRLEPYEFDGWLLELYFLDDAVVVPPDAPVGE